jgi:HEAT repeat protein
MSGTFIANHVFLFIFLSLIGIVSILVGWWYYTKKSKHFQMRKIKELGNTPLSIRNQWVLIFLTESKHLQVQLEIIDFLGRTREVKAIPLLLETLKDCPIEVKEKICWVFGEIGDHSVLNSALDLLSDSNEKIWTTIKKSIENIITESDIDFLTQSLDTENQDLSDRIIDILINKKAISFEHIKKTMLDEHAKKNVRIASIDIIRRIKDSNSVNDLMKLLDNEKFAPYAIRALGEIGDPKAVEHILDSINHDNRAIARESALALGKFSNPEALKYYSVFGPLYSNKTFNEVKNLIVDIGDSAKEPMLLALSAKNEKIKKAITKIFGEMGEKGIKWIEEELEFTSDRSFIVGAVQALGNINLPSAVKPLEKLLFSEDQEIKLLAIESLKNNEDIKAKIYAVIYDILLFKEDNNKIVPFKDDMNIPLTKVLDFETDIKIKKKALDIFMIHGNRSSITYLEKLWQLETYKKSRNTELIFELEVAIANLKKRYDMT